MDVPAHTVAPDGWVVIAVGAFNDRVALLEVTVPHVPVTATV